MGNKVTNQHLDDMVKDWDSKNLFKKGISRFNAVLNGGVLPNKYQERVALKVGMTSRSLTTWNVIVGLGVAGLEEYFLGHHGGAISKEISDWVQTTFQQQSIMPWIAEWTDRAYQFGIDYYVKYNVAQSVFRFSYAQIKKEGITGMSVYTLFVDVVYIPILKKKEITNFIK